MPRLREGVAINANGGGYTAISPSIHCRQMTIAEDPGGNQNFGQGLQYLLPDDNFTAVHSVAPGIPIVLGNPVSGGNNSGPILGTPGYSSGGNTVPPTVVIKVISAGAQPTNITIQEYE